MLPNIDPPRFLLGRQSFDAAALVATHPARFTDRNKKAVYALTCPPGIVHRGSIEFSRWQELPLPAVIPPATDRSLSLDFREDVFGYEPLADATRPVVEWYLNFSHSILFVAYGGSLFAQDEAQVLEHPALASLHEALQDTTEPGVRPLTREGDDATPVLISGVERRCAIATDADLDAGRPLGLYGNRFARAPVDVVLRATKVLSPPTRSNIIAMEAPTGGVGRYTIAQIKDILATAYTGFAAARVESDATAESADVVVHTGHWGCGAYGGDRVLMAMLQMLAAQLAGIDRLTYHTVDAHGSAAWREADELFERDVRAESGRAMAEVLDRIVAMGFTWGASDGN